jgi:cellulose synthase/poly-beta-1,6-N-acetylglucosamine synthase-like glycosyltransferase
MIFTLITILLLLAYSLLLWYYRKSWKALPEFKATEVKTESPLPFVSIIIAARNEEINIGACIQSLIAQSYPTDKFEIIITDDHSTDNTVSVVQSFKEQNIRLLHLSQFTSGEVLNSYKKKSIETAIQFAEGELIMTTDADCVVPRKWIETFVSLYLEKNPVFIAAPVVIKAKDDVKFAARFFENFQALDFMTLQGITGASVQKGFHNMCNGANLAYQKRAFYAVNGFEGIDEIASGDDMLLMHKIEKAFPYKIAFLRSRDVIVETQAAASIKDFMNQRIRWASKADHYTDKKITAVLLFVYFINAWILILAIASFFFAKALWLFLISIIWKTIMELIFLFPVAKFFRKEKLLWWFLPAQPFHIIYTVIAGWLGKFGTYQWKGRNVK